MDTRTRIVGWVVAALCAAFASSLAMADDGARSFRAGQMKSMTQNLYVGGDIFLPLQVPPDQFPAAAQAVIEQIIATNYRERAPALASEMLAEMPHAIGLQEVYQIQVCVVEIPGLCILDDDYLQILLDELNAGGDHYRAAATVENINLSGLLVPADIGFGPVTLMVTIIDRDAILVRSDVSVDDAYGRNFCAGVPVNNPLLPSFTKVLRGYVVADIQVNGRDYRFVNTHLEITADGSADEAAFRTIQFLQAAELVGPAPIQVPTICEPAGPVPPPIFGSSAVVVMVGDFNSNPVEGPFESCLLPGGACPTPYAFFTGGVLVTPAGAFDVGPLIDTWLYRADDRWEEGYSCCQDALLDNPESELYERIDQVWMKPAPDHYGGPYVRGVDADVVGDTESSRTPSGLWPSDHAGVAVKMTLRTPN
jgi:hypothetical protein